MTKPDNHRGKGPRKAKQEQRRNPGLPDKETVIGERTFVSPKGKHYRIIKTTERDVYDPPEDKDKSKN